MGLLSELLVPSPNDHIYITGELVSLERFVIMNWLIVKHCTLSLIENLAFGERLTIVVLVRESEQPKVDDTFSSTLNIPVVE